MRGTTVGIGRLRRGGPRRLSNRARLCRTAPDLAAGRRGDGRQVLRRKDETARGDDDQPAGGGLGRAQQAQHGAMHAARQADRRRPRRSKARHGDEHGHHALQRVAVLVDCGSPVHRGVSS
ncbi:hypothetical protein QBK99_11975 [Corticibacterium sp. UT-5YL-CI-8]|nr:hypothetical protein [Tianweitania sp. UT-5YL-CI-8]